MNNIHVYKTSCRGKISIIHAILMNINEYVWLEWINTRRHVLLVWLYRLYSYCKTVVKLQIHFKNIEEQFIV